MAEPLYPVSEVAALWRCSVDHIYDLIAAGELAATQIATGRAKTRVPESALADYVRRHTTPARKARPSLITT